MYLDVLSSGHRPRARAALWLAENVGRSAVDDVGKTSLYRPELFGRSFLALTREVLRGPSEWSVGERELFAAFVSKTNRCAYCTDIHSRLAGRRLERGVPEEALANWSEADHDPKVKAVFRLLERVTMGPEGVTPADVEAVRAEGVSDAAIVDALYVAFVFNLINRVADALGFEWTSGPEADKAAKALDRIGYRLPPFLMK